MSIYKANDIRGTFGRDLTREVAWRIGKAVGHELRRETVVVAGDVRLSTPVLKEGLIEGLRSSGCRVIDIGIVPTPAFYFAKQFLKARGGVAVTGSHNPPGDNGFKIILGDLPVTSDDIARIERRVEEEDFAEGPGSVENIVIVPDYIRHVRELVSAHCSLRIPGRFSVVVDASNGCYSEIAPGVLRNLGLDVVELCCTADGSFPCHLPDPAVRENLSLLCEEVKKKAANIGVGFDADGDRVVFVDDKGEVIDADKSIIIIARHLLARRKGKVVYDLKCSSIVPEEITRHGGTALMEKSGHAFIKRRVIEEKAVLGGEISGHFFYPFLDGGDDGLFTAILMIDIVLRSGRKLSEMASEITGYFTTPDIRLRYEGQDRAGVLEKIKNGLSGYPVDTLDGVRVSFPGGWGLARLSISEPLITFRFEGKTREELSRVMEEFLKPVPEVRRLVEKKYRELGK